MAFLSHTKTLMDIETALDADAEVILKLQGVPDGLDDAYTLAGVQIALEFEGGSADGSNTVQVSVGATKDDFVVDETTTPQVGPGTVNHYAAISSVLPFIKVSVNRGGAAKGTVKGKVLLCSSAQLNASKVSQNWSEI